MKYEVQISVVLDPQCSFAPPGSDYWEITNNMVNAVRQNIKGVQGVLLADIQSIVAKE